MTLSACFLASPDPPAPPTGAVTGTLRLSGGASVDTTLGPVVVLLQPLETDRERNRPEQLFRITSSTDRFEPPFAAIARGDFVVFANEGSVSHRLFSAHLGADLQIVVSPGDASTPQRIDRTGEVRFFCSLHPDESFSIFVTADVFSAVVDRDGGYYIGPVPNGSYRLSMWSPQLDGAVRTVEVVGGGTLVEPIVLDPSRIRR